MKINPEIIILNKNESIDKKKIFLISGNEETLIKKIEKEIIEKLKIKGHSNIEIIENNLNESNVNLSPSNNLFGELKIIVSKNPKEIDFKFLETINVNETAIIISHTNLNNSSKMKKNFEKNNNFITINCYKLNKDSKKIYLDNFLNKNSIKLNQDTYWFFLENTSDLYQIFENEMEKILNFPNSSISIEMLRKILPKNENYEIEKLFFLVVRAQNEIIIKTTNTIKSVSDSIIMLQRIKYFVNLLSSFERSEDVEKNFPKYLFKEKATFLSIFKKKNPLRLEQVFSLIKKTEILLRKNGELFLPISQRFLINLSKNLK